MSKRFMAALMVAIFVLGVALIVPAQAHHTIGRPTDTMPYRVRDHEEFVSPDGINGHVPGLTGYVWPGSGKDWYTGDLATGPGDLSEPPGYQSPWTTYPPGPPWPTWWQLRSNTYSPFGAILTSEGPGAFINKGDLIFAINFTNPGAFNALPDKVNYSKLEIYIPPEFIPPVDWEGGDTSNIVVSTPCAVTVSVGRVDLKDAIAPNWWKITIEEDNALDIAFIFTSANNYEEWYYVRVNAMGAPYIAGRYFFKMLANGTLPTDIIAAALGLHRFGAANAVNADGSIRATLLADTDGDGVPELAEFFPVENWPALLVKGEVDPGIIEGTVYYGTWASALYGERMELPGVVRAVGLTPEGRPVEARGYFNASARGHFEIEGVAPGTYDIYASAAGYPEQKVAEGIVVYAGKSVHLDIYLEPGVVVWGRVFSKHGMADVEWTAHVEQLPEAGDYGWPPTGDAEESGNDYVSPIMVEIYDSNEWPAPRPGYVWGDVNVGVLDESLLFERGTPTDLVWTDEGYKPATPGHLLSWSPINLWDEPYTSYGRVNPLAPSPVAFPWETNPYDQWPNPPTEPSDGQFENIFNGVGPPIVWWTRAGTTSFEFKFGDKDTVNLRIYGAPTAYDGHVPQLFATWTDGLKPGVYYMRVWTTNYVQTDVMGAYVDYSFEVAAEEWAGDVYVPIDLQLSSKINKTVHFHDLPGEIEDRPIGGPDPYRWLIAEVRDDEGNLVAFNFRQVSSTADSAWILLWGFGWAGPDPTATPRWYFLYGYRHIRDYGMMPGTYMVYVYMRGYVQQEFEWASVTLTGGVTWISNHMYRGAGINVTVFSKDWEHPAIFRPWVFPGEDVSVTVINVETGDEMGTIKYWDGDSWETPTTREGEYMVPWLEGWGVEWSKLKFNGSTRCEEDGPGSFVPDASYYRFGAERDWATNIGLETGEYKFSVSVKGYVFKDADKFIVYAAKGQQADTKLNVVIGANITATIIFKREGVIECTPFDMDMEVELYDEEGSLIGTAEAYEITLCDDTLWTAPTGVVGTWVPVGAKQVIVHWYGVDAYPNYDGDWWIEVDTWTKYDDYFGTMDGVPGPWHPPVVGLLMGKDYHLIAGDPGFQGDAKAFNHLGPYEQRVKIRVPNTHLSGEASVIFELDRMGYLSGQIYGFTWSNEMRTTSWATVTASGEFGEFALYSIDGFYEGFLPAGAYMLTIEHYHGDLGHYSVTASVNVPDGGSATYSFEGLELSGIPIPEFPVAAIALASALAASLYILRRSKK